MKITGVLKVNVALLNIAVKILRDYLVLSSFSQFEKSLGLFFQHTCNNTLCAFHNL